MEDTAPRTQHMASGSSEVMTQMGTTVMMIENKKDGCVHEYILKDVYYPPSVNINFISMDYLQRVGFNQCVAMIVCNS